MKDWKEWFNVRDSALCHGYDTMEEDRYQAYKARLIEEGFIEANPKRWVRPTMEEVTKYFVEHDFKMRIIITDDDIQNFYDYWDSLDWKRGKARIKNWKLTANTWIKNNEKYKKSNGSGLASYDNESTNWG